MAVYPDPQNPLVQREEDAFDQVIPDSNYHSSRSLLASLRETTQEDDMASRMTVAQLYSKHQDLSVQVDNLSSALSEALEALEAQNKMVAALETELIATRKVADGAHGRLDKARDAIQSLKSTQTQTATTQARQATTASDARHKCTVPGAHNTETTHTKTELNACWQQFYSQRANA